MSSVLKSVLVSAVVLSPFGLPFVAWGETFEIEIGDPITGELTEETLEHRYTFTAAADQSLHVFLRSDDFDTVLSVLDADGEELFFNDDSAGYGLNSRIGPFVLPEDGEYTLVVESFIHRLSEGMEGNTGTYQLILSEAPVSPLTLGEPIEGSLSVEMPFAFFSFESEEPLISFGELTANFAGILQLQDEEGLTLAAPGFGIDFSTSTPDSETLTVFGTSLRTSGIWMVGSLDGSGEGDFTLTVDTLPVTPIAFGEELEGSVAASTPVFYSFEAEANTVIDVRVTAEDELDTTLSLLDPEGFELAFSGDALGLDPALESVVLPVDGTYTLVVKSFGEAEDAEGSFVISLAEAEVPDLMAGGQTASFSNQRRQALFRFEAEQGDRLQLSLEQVFEDGVEPEFRELSFAIRQGQEVIANGFDAGSLLSRSFVVQIPADGLYFLELNESSFFEDFEQEWASTTTITLTVEGDQMLPAEQTEATEAETPEAETPEADAAAPTPRPRN